MMKGYILNGHEPEEVDYIQSAAWFSTADRSVAKTDIGEEVFVSTVFLGIDHNHSGKGPPVLFETMVFGGKQDGLCHRYCTWDEAEVGHHEVVDRITGANIIPLKRA